MRKYILLLVLAVALLAQNPEVYSLIRVDWNWTPRVASDVVNSRPGVWAEYALPESEIANLQFERIPYEVIIPDMTEHYRSRLNTTMDMGGWRTLDMIHSALDSMHESYPALVSAPETLGFGHDGNSILVIKISDNVEVDEDEPEVCIGLGIHAREVIAPEIIIQFAQWLLENYGIDERATHIVDTREVWFIPMMNPDGYLYNEILSPGGGGMWRKNRRNNGGGTWGVDLNRNFPHMWGYDDTGSSPTPSEETYRGPSAGSEPETQAILDFTNSRNFRSMLSFHSYSNLYLTPWGYTYELCDDDDWFLRIGYRYARNNGYVYGSAAATIYPTNGDTDDWFYGDTTEHSKILAVTPEVGGSGDGFWPDIERKQPLVDENHEACVVCCQVAGSAPFLTHAWIDDFTTGDSSGFADPGETFNLMLEIENLGWEASKAFALAFTEVTGVGILTDSAHCGEIETQDYDTTSFRIYLDPARIEAGEKITIYFEIRDINGHLTFDSTSFFAGTPEFVQFYNFEAGDGGFSRTNDWEWGVPEVGPDQAYSGEKLWGTNLDDDYTNNTLSILSMPPFTVPTEGILPSLTFYHWFSFEMPSGDEIYDGGNVQISTDGGSSWNVLSPVSGYDGVAFSYNPHVGGDSVFTGSSGGWRYEIFDLSDYEGASVEIRFAFGADPYVRAPGWYIDDVAIIYYVSTGFGAGEQLLPKTATLETYPNPFNSACRIDFTSAVDKAEIEIFDIGGRLVRTLKPSSESGSVIWDGRDSAGGELPNGVYLIRSNTSRTKTAKAVLMK